MNNRLTYFFILIGFLLYISGCTPPVTGPINTHTNKKGIPSPQFIPEKKDNDGSLILGISFSGGGTRAASFAYGALRELEIRRRKDLKSDHSILEDIRMIAGTSGGSVTASYFAYKGMEYHDLKERFLLQDAEKELNLRFSILNAIRLVRNAGGNDLTTFARWMNKNLFQGKTFEALRGSEAPLLWITATDIHNTSVFNFDYDTFSALCSDLDKVRLADAVAASAALPLIFTPVIVSSSESIKCDYTQPEWVKEALINRESLLSLQARAKALNAYQKSTKDKYIRLLDGGLTDNLGISGIFLKRAASNTEHGPLSAKQAVNLKSFLYIVIDAGGKSKSNLTQTLQGKLLTEVINASTEATIEASEQREFDALRLQLAAWKKDVVNFRCNLAKEKIIEHRGNMKNWNCEDIEMKVERISFGDLPSSISNKLNLIPTRLKLPQNAVEFLIWSGREAIRKNKEIQETMQRNNIYIDTIGQNR